MPSDVERQVLDLLRVELRGRLEPEAARETLSSEVEVVAREVLRILAKDENRWLVFRWLREVEGAPPVEVDPDQLEREEPEPPTPADLDFAEAFRRSLIRWWGARYPDALPTDLARVEQWLEQWLASHPLQRREGSSDEDEG